MASMWDNFFGGEPQGWWDSVANSLKSCAEVIVRIPETIVVLIMASILIVWDFICSQARFFISALQMEEWWTVEHTYAFVFTVASVVAVLRRGRGNWVSQLSQICVLIQVMTSIGCFARLAAGIQDGGGVFYDKLFYPTLALLSLAFQITRAIMLAVEKEMYGYVEESHGSHEKAAGVFRNMGRLVCIMAAITFLIAAFGPPREGNHLSLVALFPVIGALRLLIILTEPETASDDDGKEEPSGTQAEQSEPEAEGPMEQPEEPASGSIWQRTVNVVVSYARAVLEATLGGWTFVVSLSWSHIFETVAAFGASLALTYAYWTLTEDLLTWLASFFALIVPIVSGQAEAKNWLSSSTTFLILQACHVTMAVSQYHLFRCYVLI